MKIIALILTYNNRSMIDLAIKKIPKAFDDLIDAKRILIVVEEVTVNLALASRNIPYVEVIEAVNLNPVLLVSADKVIATPEALKQLEGRLV